jgi:hypothetical protein
MDLVDKIIAWESGELGGKETLEFFSELIENGQAWTLQGSYGRTASNLIERGLISKEGEINWDLFEELVNA